MSLSEHDADAMCVRWRAQPEDTIGGWCVTAEDDTRTPADGAIPYGEFSMRHVAQHVADAHNAWLEQQ